MADDVRVETGVAGHYAETASETTAADVTPESPDTENGSGLGVG